MRGWKFLILACVLLMPTVALAQETKLLDFYADWCGPCKAMTPVVEQLAAEGYQVQRVNVDANRELAAQYGVQNIPCFVVVEDGRELDRITGRTTIERLKVKLHRKRVEAKPVNGQKPHPAWRYERPVGCRAAVVRITCNDGGRTRSLGSGTLIRWAGKVVVLTARHVVADAKSIAVRTARWKWYRAQVLKADATWDCAVLILDGTPDVDPADLEFGDAAMQREGNKLESCGYGPDDKLACNSGLFIGYRRSTDTPNGPDDWFEISGHARPGDSGGPIFNARGRLVGVLWGANGKAVAGVQAGRVQVVLNEALGLQVHQRSVVTGRRQSAHAIDPREFTLLQYRQPTPALPCEPGCNCTPDDGGWYAPPVSQDAGKNGGYLLPGREKMAEEFNVKIDRLEQQLSDLTRAIQQSQGRPDANTQAALADAQRQLADLQATKAAAEAKETAKPKESAIDEKIDAALHKLAVQGPIAKHLEGDIEKGGIHAIFGDAGAIVFLTLLAVIPLLGIILVGHAIYKKCHADAAGITATLSAVPGVGAGLAAGFNAVDQFNTNNVEPLIAKATTAIQGAVTQAKADLTSHVAALNTPAPGQASAPTATPAPVSVNVTTPTK